MMGMNAKDALGALEDIAIYNNVLEAERARHGTAAIQERAGTVNRLKGELADVKQNRNYAATLLFSAAKTLDHVIRDFARAVGVSEDELRKRYNAIRTQNFNREVNEGMVKGWFDHDPRLDMSDEQKKWYVPGLDADHGF